ncbi:alpha-amylase [Paenalkalicoccus suaedae]|uniref:Alpha-amylase n=1 Tax=Paenalkalicoccus suaedae TaxID=2592382 RepID=A0A859FIX6_9BACI|nr:alpha-amylase [Paenalkalicoccus suaedae]QKS72910.1 alpha-amylase [Paenalkalicoccus suaedae]
MGHEIRNHTMMQFFEWHLANDGDHWKRLKELAPELREVGIDAVWIPPPTKGASQEDNGYGVYDVYDLGEFDQKGTVRTKYGTKDELTEAIAACHEHGVKVYADVVMNHKAGADDTEVFQVIEVDGDNRHEEISEPFDIEGWTSFTFPGRDGAHSDFTWSFHHFNGTDYDAKEDKVGIFRILGDNKEWNSHVDDEFGNYDYLMFANIHYEHPEVREEMLRWGNWFATETQTDGFRLDAIKHINHEFLAEFISKLREEKGDDFYFVAEFWHPDLEAKERFLEYVDYAIDLFDVSLHYKFYRASTEGSDFDLRTMFDETLVGHHPYSAVTFVDNHDSQPDESLESWVEDWFKPIAYSMILLRKDGYPCVFYGDYFGINGDNPIDGKKEILDPLLIARRDYAYGDQDDYFDHGNTIGWVRYGIKEVEGSGCAVVLSNGEEGDKHMFVGDDTEGEVWYDITGNREEEVTIGEDGKGVFPVNGGSVSVYVRK